MPTADQKALMRQIVKGIRSQVQSKAAVKTAVLDEKQALLHLDTSEGPMRLYIRTVKPKKKAKK